MGWWEEKTRGWGEEAEGWCVGRKEKIEVEVGWSGWITGEEGGGGGGDGQRD